MKQRDEEEDEKTGKKGEMNEKKGFDKKSLLSWIGKRKGSKEEKKENPFWKKVKK